MAPSAPGSIKATALSTTSVKITWGAARDARGVTSYLIYRNGAKRPLVQRGAKVRSFTDTKLRAGSSYTYLVRARDRAGNLSKPSRLVRVKTRTATAAATGSTAIPAPPALPQPASTPPAAPSSTPSAPAEEPPAPAGDTTAPSVPKNVVATGISEQRVLVSWTAASDDTRVTAYEVERDGVRVATVDADVVTFIDTGLTPSTEYTYRVRARDAAANVSAASLSSVATTTAPLMVALGDSYSSGNGAETTPGPAVQRLFPTPWGFSIWVNKPTIAAMDLSVYERDETGQIKPCTRSTNNAARRIATTQGYELRDVSCAGATTDTILTSGQNGEPAQIEAVTADTKLVTMTIGGNDVLLLAALGCVAEENPCTDQSNYMVQVNERILGLRAKITAVIDAIAQRAPNAQVRFAGYPYLLPLPNKPNDYFMCQYGLLVDSERVVMQRATDRTNAAIKAAVDAATANVRFIDPTATGSPFMTVDSDGARDVCGVSSQRWINGYGDGAPQESTSPQIGGAYGAGHPNALGYGYYAELYLATL